MVVSEGEAVDQQHSNKSPSSKAATAARKRSSPPTGVYYGRSNGNAKTVVFPVATATATVMTTRRPIRMPSFKSMEQRFQERDNQARFAGSGAAAATGDDRIEFMLKILKEHQQKKKKQQRQREDQEANQGDDTYHGIMDGSRSLLTRSFVGEGIRVVQQQEQNKKKNKKDDDDKTASLSSSAFSRQEALRKLRERYPSERKIQSMRDLRLRRSSRRRRSSFQEQHIGKENSTEPSPPFVIRTMKLNSPLLLSDRDERKFNSLNNLFLLDGGFRQRHHRDSNNDHGAQSTKNAVWSPPTPVEDHELRRTRRSAADTGTILLSTPGQIEEHHGIEKESRSLLTRPLTGEGIRIEEGETWTRL